MEIITIIPARSGSKTIKNKNIKLLNNKPLLAYSIESSLSVPLISQTIVSTDSPKYAQIAKKAGASVPFLRPKDISKDTSIDCEYINHFLQWVKNSGQCLPDYLVLLRPTTPLRNPKTINQAIKKIINNTNCTSLRSLHAMSETAYKKVEISGKYIKLLASISFDIDKIDTPRQMLPRTYDLNGYVDIFKVPYVLRNKKPYGDRVIPFLTETAYEIDTIEDFEYLEYIIKGKQV